jgi:hypothetical protein
MPAKRSYKPLQLARRLLASSNKRMTETEPPDPDPSSAPSQPDFPDAGANRTWSLAITLITLWRGANGQDRRTAVAQMLAAIAAEGGPAAVEQAALGLTDVAGMLLELYADHADASPDQVLQEAATLMADIGPWG